MLLSPAILKKDHKTVAAHTERCCQDSEQDQKIWTYHSSPQVFTLAPSYI